MYCGSCLRDNALAAELLARGHDVLLLPVYTPDPHRRGERQRRPRVLRRASASTCSSTCRSSAGRPAVLDWLWDTPGRHPGRHRPRRLGRPRGPGRADRLDAEGEEGFQAKEFRKLAAATSTAQPPFDVVVLPELAAHRPGRRPCSARSAVPSSARCRARTCSSRACREPYRDGVDGAHRARTRRRVDALRRDERLLRRLHGRLPRPAARQIHTVPLGINLDGHRARPRRRATGPFTIGYFARIAPEKGLHLLAEAYRDPAARARASPPSRLEAAGYLAPEHRGYLAGVEATLRDGGPRGRVPLPRRRSTATRRSRSCSGLDVLSVPSPYAEPKGLYLLEALANGVPVRAAAPRRLPRDARADGRRACCSSPTTRASLADAAARRSPATAARRGSSAARGAEGVRRHYTVGAHGRARARGLRRVTAAPARGQLVRGTERSQTCPVLERRGRLARSYATPRGPLPILDGVSFALARRASRCA